jgi:hypothetical protein
MENCQLTGPRFGIYTGTGASHSWLWFIDLFEKAGFLDLTFLDEFDVQEGELNGLDGFATAGGDTFALANALGPQGAEGLARFVENGGIYLGSCAGAYLPMRSSKAPLDQFNFVDVRITNLTSVLPTPQRMAGKFCTAYGCRFVFHPVRETVTLAITGKPPAAGSLIDAPLYGGPGMIAGDDAQVLAVYRGFTDKTLFLVDRRLAEETLIGTAAAVRQEKGRGVFYLFGPHFEHPRYPDANRFLLDIIEYEMDQKPGGTEKPTFWRRNARPRAGKALVRDVKRELSNARIVAAGLEMLPLQWWIGEKIYEPTKIRVFLDSLWRRVRPLEKADHVHFTPGCDAKMLRLALEITGTIRALKQRVDENLDATPQAKELFHRLQGLSKAFLQVYFDTRAAEAMGDFASFTSISGELN